MRHGHEKAALSGISQAIVNGGQRELNCQFDGNY